MRYQATFTANSQVRFLARMALSGSYQRTFQRACSGWVGSPRYMPAKPWRQSARTEKPSSNALSARTGFVIPSSGCSTRSYPSKYQREKVIPWKVRTLQKNYVAAHQKAIGD